MRTRTAALAAMMSMTLVITGVWGCGDDEPTRVDPPSYSDAATPEDVVEDLQISYQRREIDRYSDLLSAEFKFIFLESDAQGLPKDFYTHDEDSLATRTLFEGQDLGGTGGDVTDINIDLTSLSPESATLDRFPGEEITLVRIINTFLDVNLNNGTTLRVSGDQQLFYLRPGKPGLGEDPARWYLVEWQDLGGLLGKTGARAAAVARTTWGSIKTL